MRMPAGAQVTPARSHVEAVIAGALRKAKHSRTAAEAEAVKVYDALAAYGLVGDVKRRYSVLDAVADRVEALILKVLRSMG